MTNEVQGTRIEAKIYTTRGEITIHCRKGERRASYRYRSLKKLDPYTFGPVVTTSQIRSRLQESLIKPTSEIIAQIQAAIDLIERLVNE